MRQASTTSSRASVGSSAARSAWTQLKRRSDSDGIWNLCGSPATSAARPLLLREREAHLGLVERECDVHDLLDAELQPVAHVDLVRALQVRAQEAHIVDHRHAHAL